MPKGYKGREKTERLHMLISPEEISAVDDWRFKNRVGTRAEAVRRLIQIGRNFDAVSQKLAQEAYAAVDKMDRFASEIAKLENGQQPAGDRPKIGKSLQEALEAQRAVAVLLGALVDAGQTWRFGSIDEAGEYEKLVMADAYAHAPQRGETADSDKPEAGETE